MKITKAALRKIIQEEFEAVRSEGGDHEQQDLQNAVHDLSELVVNQIYARTGVTTDLDMISGPIMAVVHQALEQASGQGRV